MWGGGGVLVSCPLVLVEATGPSAGLLSPSVSWAGIPEDSKVEGPAFTDAIRMYRQSKELYGTWEMLCGNEVQVRPDGLVRKPQKSPEDPTGEGTGLGTKMRLWGAAGLEGDDMLRFGQVQGLVLVEILTVLFITYWASEWTGRWGAAGNNVDTSLALRELSV